MRLTLTVATGTTTVLTFTSLNAGSNASPALDNVSVVSTAAAAPEPGTLALLGLGILPLAGMLARRRGRA